MTGVTASTEGSGDRCPSCQAPLAADQRYCLECGNRRGDPRLPFMDAVVFMDATKKAAEPPPPPPAPAERKAAGLSANVALIAGIATLVLAIGVGVLIGQAGNKGSATAAAPQVIKVGGSEGGGGEEGSSNEGSASADAKKKSKNAGHKKKASSSEANSSKADEEAEEASNEVLKPKVPVVKTGTQLGEKCDPSQAGCSNSGKFEGEFFGE